MRALLTVSLVLGMSASMARAGVLRLEVNHSMRLHMAGQASTVIVGNPNVADATVVDSRTVFLSGRASGSTDVVVTDALGRTLFQGDVAVAPAGSAVNIFSGTQQQALACAPICRPQDPAAAPNAPTGASPGAPAIGGAPGAVMAAMSGAPAAATP